MKRAENYMGKKPFRPLDIAVYALIALLIAASFAFSGKTSGKGFEVYVSGEKVLEYTFGGGYLIYGDRVTVQIDGTFRITCDNGYNVLSVNDKERDASIVSADCSGKHCERMKLSSGSIICSPHSLVIKFVDKIDDPLVG